ncbi:MAG: hypothetical protein L3J16_02225 [Anaerolineales bacterium]|nr:hypothetical protein [Anaerolineales bacterium]
MKTPKELSTWFMVLFFLFAALGSFGIFSNGILSGIFALGAAVTLFLDK